MLLGMDFAQRPMLMFWETTRACPLACRHCRASATTRAPAGEMTTAEALDPLLVARGTGTSPLVDRPDLAAHPRAAFAAGIRDCPPGFVLPI